MHKKKVEEEVTINRQSLDPGAEYTAKRALNRSLLWLGVLMAIGILYFIDVHCQYNYMFS